jgi:class 3 adenylate cyclase
MDSPTREEREWTEARDAPSQPLQWGEGPVSPEVGEESRFVLPTGTVTLLLADIEGSARLRESQAKAMPV